jgi:NADPH-dependent 2,4-dienoyl-CoA reductase/sulfur reductase-like enzyme
MLACMNADVLQRPSPGVVIAGGGLAAQRAAESLRRNGYDGTVRMIAGEPDPPYDRPPLSKEYLAGDIDESALRFRSDDWYVDNAIDIVRGDRAAGLDVHRRQVVLESGERVPFCQLLIATGSMPRRLHGTERYQNVHELRSLSDARRLRAAITPGSRVAVIGAGFIGLEVASTARRRGAEVTIIEAAEAPLAAVLGIELGLWFARLHRDEDIDVRLSAQIARLHGARAVAAVELEDGSRIRCDTVVVGIGTVPATAWLRETGLDHAGVPVDAAGRTAIPGIYAAGDASKPFDHRLGVHVRTEHWEAAARAGAGAARAMLGLDIPAPATPSFWSDQHGIRIHYIGRGAAADGLRIDGDPDERNFTATFSHRGRPVAALLVGRSHALPELRREIARGTTSAPPERSAA